MNLKEKIKSFWAGCKRNWGTVAAVLLMVVVAVFVVVLAVQLWSSGDSSKVASLQKQNADLQRQLAEAKKPAEVTTAIQKPAQELPRGDAKPMDTIAHEIKLGERKKDIPTREPRESRETKPTAPVQIVRVPTGPISAQAGTGSPGTAIAVAGSSDISDVTVHIDRVGQPSAKDTRRTAENTEQLRDIIKALDKEIKERELTLSQAEANAKNNTKDPGQNTLRRAQIEEMKTDLQEAKEKRQKAKEELQKIS